jgi:hypothetical protein
MDRAVSQELPSGAPAEQLPSEVILAFAPLHRLAMGTALGVVMGGGLFLATMFLVLKGGYPVGPNLVLLNEFLIGYTVTFTGAFVGGAWFFAIGFLLGYGFAVAHNIAIWMWLVFIRSKAEMEQYGDFLDHM